MSIIKNFYTLATNLNVLYNYFDSLIKLLSDIHFIYLFIYFLFYYFIYYFIFYFIIAKFLDTSTKPFFSRVRPFAR